MNIIRTPRTGPWPPVWQAFRQHRLLASAPTLRELMARLAL